MRSSLSSIPATRSAGAAAVVVDAGRLRLSTETRAGVDAGTGPPTSGLSDEHAQSRPAMMPVNAISPHPWALVFRKLLDAVSRPSELRMYFLRILHCPLVQFSKPRRCRRGSVGFIASPGSGKVQPARVIHPTQGRQ